MTSTSSSSQPENIVIIGGGIIGVSTAYYLSRDPSLSPNARLTIVEGTAVAAGASGYAGGFLARDDEWHMPETAALSQMSFDLHRELAEKYNGPEKWGYRPLETFNISVDPSKPHQASPVPWLPHSCDITPKGSIGSTAQCMPELLTKHLCSLFLAHSSAALLTGQAISLERSSAGTSIKGITVRHTFNGVEEDVHVPCDTLVLAAGPWLSKLTSRLLGDEIAKDLVVIPSQANSIVIRTKEKLTPHAVFAKIEMGGKENENEPEVYCRPDGTTYFCGTAGPEPLPDTAAQVPFSQIALDKIHREARALAPVFRVENGAEVVKEGACYLPNSATGKPMIGKVQGVEGVWIGAGHGVWGITQGPGTGLVLAEMILGKQPSADISALAP